MVLNDRIQAGTLRYQPLERLPVSRPVNRVEWLEQFAAGKRVLDIGAMDETSVEVKGKTELWLHGRLAKVARSVLGVDNSAKIPDEGIQTSPNSRIIHGDAYQVGEFILQGHDFDVVIAGEFIEHIPNVLLFFQNMAKHPALKGKTLVCTTPNSTSVLQFLVGLFSRESQHEDHLHIFSYKTLSTLCARAPFKSWRLIPYYTDFSEARLTGSPRARVSLKAFEGLIRSVERVSPLLGRGWILVAQL
jgi:hypothetical protein